MSEQFGTIIPIWNWHPVLVGLFVFGIDFGGIMLVRIVLERKFYLERWWSFWVGGSLGLPVFAGFAAVVVHDVEPSVGFYTSLWWHIPIIVFGYALNVYVQWRNVQKGFFKPREPLTIRSEFYNSLVFGVMFYLVVATLPPLMDDHTPIWATAGAIVGLGIWVICFGIDQTPLVDKTLPPKGRKKARSPAR